MGYGPLNMGHISAKVLPPAVILGLCPTGLAAIRELGKANVEIFGYDPCTLAVGYASKFCRRIKGLNDDTPENLCESLVNFSRRFSVQPVLIPTSDDFLEFVCTYADQLKPFFSFEELSQDELEFFINKQKFYDYCKKFNVPHPIVFRPSNRRSLLESAEKITYPVIIKPIYVHLWARKFGTRKVFEAEDSRELLEAYDRLGEMKTNVLVQEIIPGEDDQLFIFAAYFDTDSVPHQIFTGRKLRQFPPGFGTTVLAESVQCDTIVSSAIALMQGIGYQGLCDIEFKYDSRCDSFKILEVNPRIGRWYSITTASNRQIVSCAYEHITQIKLQVNYEKTQRLGVKWVFIYRDVFAFLKLWRQKKISWKDWYHSWRDSSLDAVIETEDWWPTFAYVGEMFFKVFKLKLH